MEAVYDFIKETCTIILTLVAMFAIALVMPIIGTVMLLWVMVASWIPGSTEGYHRRPYRQARVEALAWLGRGYSLLLVLVVLIVIWPN